MLKIVALLTKCTKYTGRTHYLLSGVLHQKLLRSHGKCCFLVLLEFMDLFYTLYFINFPTNKSHKVLNHGNMQVKDHT
jgi:hypothetical protein